jgi:hypothetical protein
MNLEGWRDESLTRDAEKNRPPLVPHDFAEWLCFWNDDISELDNLRELEHWLRQAQSAKLQR